LADKSAIQWTEATWNPVTGCTKVSPGCANCYIERTPAFRMAHRRFERGSIPVLLHADRLDQPLRWKRPRLVFVNSLSDLFHEDVPDEFIDRVFAVMALASRHTFQVLTKRPERMRAYVNDLSVPWGPARLRSSRPATYFDWQRGTKGRIFNLVVNSNIGRQWRKEHPQGDICDGAGLLSWPLPNLWLGTSVENQHWANIRVPELIQTAAAVHFLSCEPLLGPVDLTMLNIGKLEGQLGTFDQYIDALAGLHADGMGFERKLAEKHRIRWVIAGGESGPRGRWLVERTPQGWQPTVRGHSWVSSLRDQCVAAGVPFFFKQWGGTTPKAGGRRLDGREWDEMPVRAR